LRWVFAAASILPCSLAQDAQKANPAIPSKEQQTLGAAASKGFTLPAAASVHDNVSVQAVLLPERVARPVFGREISQNYVAIELIVSNRSQDHDLVVHTIYIDYRNWLLSGTKQSLVLAGLLKADAPVKPDDKSGTAGPAKTGTKAAAANPCDPDSPPEPGCASWETATQAGEVASVEYRVARGELLDKQPWTLRNIAINSLTFLGSVASGYAFPFKEMGITKGISAYNGDFLPAARALFPDGTIQQLDNISDFGFRANKVIGKGSSEIVVAFFPIDRFLTPGLKKIFLQSPAVFFVTASGLVDDKMRRQILPILNRFLGDKVADQVKFSEPCDEAVPAKPALPSCGLIMGILSGISLNNVQVVVGGSMTVDVDSIPPRIDSVSFDNSDAWSKGTGDVTGTIQGTFLEGGTITLVNASDLGNPAISAVKDGSTNEQLHFKLTLTKAVPSTVKEIRFRVTKTKNNTTVTSNDYSAPIPSAPAATDTTDKTDKKDTAK
jgi:hypothetical protein